MAESLYSDDSPPRRQPIGEVATLEELDALDKDTLLRGYRAGFDNTPNYTERDRAYWHGYMNGQVDGGYVPATSISDTHRQLVAAYVARGKLG